LIQFPQERPHDLENIDIQQIRVWAYVHVLMLLAVLPLNSSGSLNNIMLRYE